MKVRILSLALAGLLTVPVLAQPDWGGRRRERGPRGDGPRMFGRLAEQLDLDEQQRTEFQEIMQAHRQRLMEQFPELREIRQAMRDGDFDRARELRQDVEAQGFDFRSSIQQAFDEVEVILTDEQFERFSQMRSDMRRWADRREEERNFRERLPEELEMNEEQRAQYEDLLRQRRQQFRDRMREAGGLMRELREAREAGDEDLAADIEAELEAMRAAAPRPDSAERRDQLLNEVRGILNEDQLPILETYYELPADEADEGETYDVRTLLRAAARSGLDRSQRKEWKDIARNALKRLRPLDRNDRDEKAEIAAEVRTQLEGLLEESQMDRFEEQLERFAKKKRDR